MKRWMMVMPLAVFLLVAVFLYRGLYLDPAELPSAMIGKPFPAFSLPDVQGEKTLTQLDLHGQPALVNVWARPARPAGAGQRLGHLVHFLSGRAPGAEQAGAAGRTDLWQIGRASQLDIRDEQGTLGLDLGVYGAPETFFIDAKGVIRYKHVGVIDEVVWREQLAPVYQALVDEARP